MLDVSFDSNLTYINCRYNMIVDFRTIGCNSLQQIACRWGGF